jgi:hypothetical protein
MELGRLKKNANEILVFSAKTYEGHALFDLRVHTVDAEGRNPKPTRKGVCCKRTLWPAIVAMIAEALAAEGEAEAEGEQ